MKQQLENKPVKIETLFSEWMRGTCGDAKQNI